jgi:glycerol-3-phosphate O-acyltransferase
MGPLRRLGDRAFDALVALLGRWLRPTVIDAGNVAACDRPHCYALAARSTFDLAATEIATRQTDLASPRAPLDAPHLHLDDALVWLSEGEGLPLLRRRSARRRSIALASLTEAARAGDALAVVPVSVFWGRAPAREHSVLRLLLSERWTAASGLRRFLGALFNRTHVFVRFGEPVALEDVLRRGAAVEIDPALDERRLVRLLRTRLRRHREALIGPDLSHRRTLLSRVLASPGVARAIQETAATEDEPLPRVQTRARRQAEEIAADLSYTAIRFWDVLLSWLWNRLYDGIEVHGVDAVQRVAETHTVIYVPTHRSHMDYLLMSYVLFYNGLMLPHVAAGRNLNIPVVGRLLRAAGAFFMRRSFRDDPLYAAVFEAYLDRMFAAGFAVEYFVEGGRSRTGRLLPPRGGMLGMTLRSFLRDASRPFAFVPVYFGYERVVEARSYTQELRGAAKRDESLGGVLRSVRFLRQSFGRVQVNFGEPVDLADWLDGQVPQWRDERRRALDGDADWFQPVVRRLGEELQQRTNAAAALNPVGLAATALLSTERQAQDEQALAAQLDVLAALVREAPVSADVTVTPLGGREVIRYCEDHGVLQREAHPLGDFLSLDARQTVLLTWYRNNVVHLFALPSLIAVLLAPGRGLSRERVQGDVASVWPYLQRELFLPFAGEALGPRVDAMVDQLVALHLVERDEHGALRAPPAEAPGHARLHQLARILMPTLERYFIAVALVEGADGVLTAETLENACVLTAQRTARLYRLDAPEFFDPTVFRRFIGQLVERGAVRSDDDGRLHASDELPAVMRGATRVLDPVFCQGVLTTRRLPELQPLSEAGAQS